MRIKSMLAAGALLAASALAAEVPGGLRDGAKVEAVVVTDFIGEHLVLPVNGKLDIPPDNLAVILLESDGGIDTVIWKDPKIKVSVTPDGVSADGELSIRSLMISQPLWYKVSEELTDQDWRPVGWKMPFAADFYVNYRKEKGVLPPEDGRQESWKIMPFRTGKAFGMTADTSVAIYNCENWSNWISGYGGTIYPARADKDHVYLRFLLAGEFPHQKHNTAFGAYIFPISEASHPDYWAPLGLASQRASGEIVMPKQAIISVLTPEQWKSISEVENEGKHFPATCGTTEAIEKIFYHSESYAKRAEIAERIANMDKFVQRIRDRIEAFRQWGADESAWLKANAPENISKAFAADFAEYEVYYNKNRAMMKTPAECRELSAQLVALANDPNMDDEEKEERCNELGRAIRTIGGCQDSAAAQFRRIAKCIRQKATEMYTTAATDAERAALMHIRQTSAEALHNRMPHEGK